MRGLPTFLNPSFIIIKKNTCLKKKKTFYSNSMELGFQQLLFKNFGKKSNLRVKSEELRRGSSLMFGIIYVRFVFILLLTFA